MVRRPVSVARCIACLSVALAGCTHHSKPDAIVSGTGTVYQGILGWKRERDQVVELETRGVVDVDVDIFAGNVTIVADERLTATTVTIDRVGTAGWGRSDDAVASLGDIRYTISLERRNGTDVAIVRAANDNPEPRFQHCDVEVHVPALGSVRINTIRGDVWVADNRGPVDIVTSRGKVRVMTPWRMNDPMTIVTSDEDIDLRIRGESTGAIDADAMGGMVKSRVQYGQWIARDARNDADTMHAVLNDGANPVVLRTSNANVLISVVNDPVSTNPFPGIW